MSNTPIPYILFPFATIGDVTSIDPTGSGDTGVVTYQYGFTLSYELDLNTDSSALPVPRRQFNQLMLDVTGGLQYLQTSGIPQWVAPGAGPASYPLGAWIGYNPTTPGSLSAGYQIWESQITANTSVPGADANWTSISGNRAVPTGTVIDYAGPNVPTGYFDTDGAAYSRTTYPTLLNAITLTQTCVTNSTNVLTVPSTAKLSIGPFAAVEGTGIPAGTFITAITNGTMVTLNQAATASGTVPITFFFWGNGDGSTTFNVPDLQRQVTAGSGGSLNPVLGVRLGQFGGGDTYTQLLSDIAPHTHAASTNPNDFFLLTRTSTSVSNSIPKNLPGQLNPANAITGPVSGQTTQTAMNIIQQTSVVLKCIKY